MKVEGKIAKFSGERKIVEIKKEHRKHFKIGEIVTIKKKGDHK